MYINEGNQSHLLGFQNGDYIDCRRTEFAALIGKLLLYFLVGRPDEVI